MSWAAVVLAGSRPGRDAFAEQFGTDLKPLIPVAGEPMVRRPVRALLESNAIGSIVVLSQAPERIAAELPADPRIAFQESRGTIAETIEQLVLKRADAFPMLVTTADHALLDAEMIAEFIEKAAGADLAIGVVEQKALLERLPQSKRTGCAFEAAPIRARTCSPSGRSRRSRRSSNGGRSSRTGRRAGACSPRLGRRCCSELRCACGRSSRASPRSGASSEWRRARSC
jgi:GTP:adenosylcobinamide-phosphate guanylyltransferase